MHATTTPPFQPVQCRGCPPPNHHRVGGRSDEVAVLATQPHHVGVADSDKMFIEATWLLDYPIIAYEQGISLLAWMGWKADIEGSGLGELGTYDKMFSFKET
ncbi:hypothetical protein Tco_0536503 [Tanacetum coccineum]